MNNDFTNQIIFCSKCGAEMKANARYCMKCGNLNPNHPDNSKYKKILDDNKKQAYVIGSGNGFNNKVGIGELHANNNGNRVAFLIFNILLLVIFSLIFIIIPIITLDSITINNILKSNIFLGSFFIGILGIYFISIQILFMKANEPWWGALIPIYNLYILNKIVFSENLKWLFILNFIPVVGSIYSFVLCYKLGKVYGKNGILTLLFGFIMIPIIAYGSSSYLGNYYVSGNDAYSLEKDFTSNKRLFFFCLFLVIIGLGGIIYNNNFVETVSDEGLSGYNYLYVKKAYTNVKDAVENNKYDCDDNEMIVGNTYYFYSSDFIYEYSISTSLVGEADGYVKVIYNGNNSLYYVSYLYNNVYLPEISINDLKNSSFTKLEDSNFIFSKPIGTYCTID